MARDPVLGVPCVVALMGATTGKAVVVDIVTFDACLKIFTVMVLLSGSSVRV